MSAETRRILRKIDSLEPVVYNAFAQAIQVIKDTAKLTQIESAVDRGDFDELFRLLSLSPAALSEISEAVRTAYIAGGTTTIAGFPKAAQSIVLGFDVHNERAESWLANESSKLVKQITEEQREAIQLALSNSAAMGNNPRTTAIDLIGVKQGDHRVGGIVGLHQNYASAVTNARQELSDPALMAKYLQRERRNRRYDAMVKAAIKEGKSLNKSDIDRIVAAYGDRLLVLRGETIARTETLSAFNAARQEALRQASEQGAVKPENIFRIWDATGDARTREAHLAMNEQAVGVDEPFTAPDGTQLMYPGDTSLGAGFDMTANCRCIVRTEVDWIGESNR